ncbi:hypothetical protein [Ruminococcus sp. zg-924]|uniref:hypothetical protein n=1 Tax=Ruminococcus sp. zg-924 TaxID=2678505 RepID=UPI00210B8E70|nr:hypothetical protein [Ruminococcus sp. zg-924]
MNYNSPNMLYCAFDYDPSEIMKESGTDPINDNLNRIENDAKKYNAYEPFLKDQHFMCNYSGHQIVGKIYDKAMVEKYPMPLTNGTWEDLSDKSTDGVFTAVASGAQFDGEKIGNIVYISVNSESSQPSYIKVKIVGKLAPPNAVPTFNQSGSIVTADSMFGNLNGLVFLKSEELYNKINSISKYAIVTSGNFITGVSSETNEIEQEKYIDFLKNQFLVKSYDEIKLESDEKVGRELRHKMPVPSFLLLIVSFSLLSISVLFVNKNINDHAIYFLCGCSRKRSSAIVACGIVLLGAIGGIINIIYILCYNTLSALSVLNIGDVLFDGISILFTALYLFVTVGISVALALIIFRKSTPIEIYRRVE